MRKQKETEKTEQQTEKRVTFVATNINTCIACGREIPEGMFVCRECEVGKSEKRCTICNRLVTESESICVHCRAMIFRLKNKD